jgi:hypothetical protein
MIKDNYYNFLYNHNLWDKLDYMERLNNKDILNFEEPYRMYLYVYNNNLKKIKEYNINDLFGEDYIDNLYLFAMYFGRTKIIKYLDKIGYNIGWVKLINNEFYQIFNIKLNKKEYEINTVNCQKLRDNIKEEWPNNIFWLTSPIIDMSCFKPLFGERIYFRLNYHYMNEDKNYNNMKKYILMNNKLKYKKYTLIYIIS